LNVNFLDLSALECILNKIFNEIFFKIGEQYRWLKEDLAKVDRSVTPWLIALTHAPWYNSYKSHYREYECMPQSMEDLLYKHGVDVMIHGHVYTRFLGLFQEPFHYLSNYLSILAKLCSNLFPVFYYPPWVALY
jgi:UDP-2,3-diacylglucosamine pyrophosphatase LpxH